MCVHLYYAYSIVSHFQEKLETLLKIKLSYSYSSSYNCFDLQAHKEKIVLTHTNTSNCIHTRIHKRYLLAFAYRLIQIFTQKYNHYVLRI